jgi:hypothetical protein
MASNANDSSSDGWGWKEPTGLAPLEQVPEVMSSEELNVRKKQQNDTMTNLTVPIASRDRLQNALNATKFWPPCLRSADPNARTELPDHTQWTEEEYRALPCIARNCPKLRKDLIEVRFFINRPEQSASARSPSLLKTRTGSWE